MAGERVRIPRREWWPWFAAAALSVLPELVGWVMTVLNAGRTRGFSVSLGQCRGFIVQLDIWRVPALMTLLNTPVLVVLPAFALWTLCRARGLRRTAAVIGRLALTFLLFAVLYQPLLAAFDTLRDEGCGQTWWPFLRWTIGRHLYLLPPTALLWVAVHRRGRGWLRRTAVGLGAVAIVLVTVRADTGRGSSVADPQTCRRRMPMATPSPAETPVQAIKRLSESRRHLAYLCEARGLAIGYPPRQRHEDARPSDEVLLARGRYACRVMSSSIGASARRPRSSLTQGVSGEPSRTLAYLCPDAAARWNPMLGRSQRQDERESAAYKARMDAACGPPRLTGPRPYRRGTGPVFTGEGGGYDIVDGEGDSGGAFGRAVRNGLVGADRTAAAVVTGIENGPICVTVAAYRAAPPLMLRGWDRVAEVGLDSPAGRLRVTSMEGIPELPVLTTRRGAYRLRVYVRDRDGGRTSTSELPVEKHLVVVFPGASKRVKLYKNTEHE